MKEYYYYIRNRRNAPIVTVCLIKDLDSVCRGVAICSLKDNPVKESGRKLAKKRAMKAYHSKRDSFPIHGKSEMKVLLRLDTGMYLAIMKCMKNKSSFNPVLIKLEQDIVAEVNESISLKDNEGEE
jgi:hypothetical protein